MKLEKINYEYKDLSPYMSKETLEYHRDNLAAGYIKRFNKKEGDSKFNEAGGFLHNLFFPQLKKASGDSPSGEILSLINKKHNSFADFKKEFLKKAMSIQGSGWVYLSNSGDIKIIKNHEIKNDIVFIVDWWEHAWALDYKHDKKLYLDNIWKILNWDFINERFSNNKKAQRYNELNKFSKEIK